jgi:hypothetical protein
MSYFNKVSLAAFFREVYTPTEQYLGSVYLNGSARKWAIKEYPGQWFESEELAKKWLTDRNEPTIKG